MEHKLHNRILSALLALVLVLTGFPVAAFAEGESVAEPETALCDVCGEEPCICMPEAEEDAADEDIETSADFAIFCDGLAVSALELCRSEKRTVTAENLPEGCTLRWQIYVPGASFWVNISGQTDESLDLSFALLGNLLDESDTALVRCAALCDGDVVETSGVLSVAVVDDPVEEEVSAEETPVEEAPAENEIELEVPVAEFVTFGLGSDIALTADDSESEYVTITIEYYYAQTNADGSLIYDSGGNLCKGGQAFDPYTAKLRYGASFSTSVTVPTLLGYQATYLGADITAVPLSYTDLSENVTLTVLYRPAVVTYTVRYFVQNIYNDQYVEHSTASGYATTGTYPEKIDKTIPGFTKLYNYPEVVAADGSTEFQIYYDRNYYLYNFNLSNGYGTEPVYARYETMLSIPDPTRAGWNFAGWDLTSITGEPREHTGCTTAIVYGDGIADILTPRVCIFDDGCTVLGNYTYTALWTQEWSSFSVMYWVENPDGNGYSFVHSIEDVPAKTGTELSWGNIFGSFANSDASLTVSVTNEIPDSVTDMYGKELNDYCTPSQVATENYNGAATVIVEGDGSAIFNVCFLRNQYTLRYYYARAKEMDGTITYEIPTDTTGYNSKTSGGTIQDATWTVVSAEPSLTGFTKVEEEKDDYTYYYFELTGRYQENIENLWPVASLTLNTDDGYSFNGWCTEYNSGYSNNTYHKTTMISGYYCELDSMMIMDAGYTAANNQVAQTLLASWTQGAVPVEFWVYVDVLGANDPNVAQADSEEYQTYMSLQTDNNGHYAGVGSNQGTDIYIDAALYSFYSDWGDKTRRYFEKRHVYSFRDVEKQNVFQNGRFTFPGFEYHARDNTGVYTRTNDDGETVKVYIFHYRRVLKTLTLDNFGSIYKTQSNIEYEMPLEAYLPESLDEDDYPSTLEPYAYEFKGWYTGPDGAGDRVVFDSTKDSNLVDSAAGIWYNPTMPDDDLILFAYWAPKTYTINFYESYEAVIENRVYKTVEVTHGTTYTSQLEIPTSPYPGAAFAGWFYYDEFGTKHAFDPETMTVTGQMKLFAEWDSSTAATYTVSYQDANGNTLGEDTVGWGYVGSTKTFTALSFSDTDGVYFPETSSHSIVIKEPTETDPTPNTYTFIYKKCAQVYYKVRFYDDTNKKYLTEAEIEQINGGTNIDWGGTWATDGSGVVFTTKKAVEDIRFTYISGYLVDSSYKRLYLSAEESESNIVYNVITFVYTKDALHARYVVRHLTETMEDDEYEEYAMLDNHGDISDEQTIYEEAMTITGFSCSEISVTILSGGTVSSENYTLTGTQSVKSYLPAEGVEIIFKYKRNSYTYTIQYQEYGTAGTQLRDSVTGTGKFEATVIPYTDGNNNSDVPNEIVKDDTTYYLRAGEESKTIIIRADDTQSITYYYEAKTSTVYYYAVTTGKVPNGGTVSKSEETSKGNSFTGAAATAATGFKFVGWYTDLACTTQVTEADGTVVGTKFTPKASEEDRSFYASFEPFTYTITWKDEDGTVLDTDTVQYGVIPTYSGETPTKEATAQYTYTFAGWTPEVVKVNGNATYTATYTSTENEYTIAFVDEDGTVLQSGEVPFGTIPTYNGTTPTKAATVEYTYTFAGWTPEIVAVTEEATYTATYIATEVIYTIVYYTNTPSDVVIPGFEKQEAKYNQEISIHAEKPEWEGHDFLGWKVVDEEKVYQAGETITVTKSMGLQAMWYPAPYNVTYKITDDNVKIVAYEYEAEVTIISNPTREGYTFEGWSSSDGKTYTAGTTFNMPAYNITLTAQWKVEQYTITFDSDGGTEVAAITQDYGTAVTAPADPTKTGYTFAGWDKEIPATMPAENLTITAKWTINQYTITFDTDGGTAINPIKQDYGTAVTAPADPTKIGHTFAGWDKDIPTTMPAENMTITARWTANQYTITFDTNGGSAIDPIKQDYGTTVTAPADPVKEGYTFAGWDATIPTTMPAENITITAQWTINQYTITFDTDGGTAINPIKQDYGTAVTAPADPTKTGYTFAGWDTEIPSTMPAENMTIKAKWTINQYTITFDTDGGSTIAPITQNYGTPVTAPGNPTKNGYSFAGWDKEIPATMPAENLTIKASWTMNTLTITQSGVADADSGIYEVLNSNNDVVVTVMITGRKSVTIERIPADNYTVREYGSNVVNGPDWTWTYEDTAAKDVSISDVTYQVGVEFNFESATVHWLHDEIALPPVIAEKKSEEEGSGT